MPIDFPLSPSLNDIYTYNSKSWTWNGYAWVISMGVGSVAGVASFNGFSGAISLSGTTQEIEINSSTANLVVGLPDNVKITGNLGISGDLDISGNIRVNGLIVTKTGFQGFTGDSDLEYIDGVLVDGGEY
jgi:hypothetical protein